MERPEGIKNKRLSDDPIHWALIQAEFPGMTKEEYEVGLDATFELIRKTFYSEKGFIKPRLVRRKPKESKEIQGA
jgi:hypothetical protein